MLCDRPADAANNGPTWAYPALPAAGPAGSAANATADSLMPEAGAVTGHPAKAARKGNAQQQHQHQQQRGAKPAAHAGGNGNGKKAGPASQHAPTTAQQPKPQAGAAQRA